MQAASSLNEYYKFYQFPSIEENDTDKLAYTRGEYLLNYLRNYLFHLFK